MATTALAERRAFLGHAVTVTQLSDSRSLMYFDDVTTPSTTRASDAREALERSATPKMRLDPLTREWVSIAPARNQRAFLPTEESCPLCAQTDANPSEVPGPFDVAVFENKSPSFGPALGPGSSLPSQTFGAHTDAVGRCEIVVFSQDHHGSFIGLDAQRIDTVIAAWTHRTEELKALPGVKTVFPFENRGEEIGVTLHHPHGQIYSYPFIPPRTSALLANSRAHGTGFFQDYLEFESRSERLVIRGDSFSAFVPYAARWPVEMILVPHRPVADFTELTDSERKELGVLVPQMLNAVNGLYESETPYIAAWYQAPSGLSGEEFRFHFRVTSPKRSENKLKFLAGSETAMGAFILDVNPETQAEQLRAVLA